MLGFENSLKLSSMSELDTKYSKQIYFRIKTGKIPFEKN